MDKVNNKQYSVNERPNQRVSINEKQQKRWYIPNGEWTINHCIAQNPDKNIIQTWYNVANGIVNVREYEAVTNPFHSDNPKLKHFPATMRNHDIKGPILLRHLGEYIKSDFKPIVGINNPDSVNKKMEAKHKFMEPIMDSILADALAEFSQGEIQLEGQTPDGQQQPNPVEAEGEFEANWKDERALTGQGVLNYLRDTLGLDNMYVNSYVDWLTAGQFYTYKDVRFDKVIAQSISPLEYYPVLNGADYIEDTNMGMRKFKMSMHDIASYFRDVLELKDLKYIEDTILNIDYASSSMHMSNAIIADRYGNAYEFFKDKYGNRGADINISDSEGLTWVYHYVFTTYTKIQILVYEDQLGKMHKKEVTADYKLNREAGDLHLEAEYVNEMWNGYRIGDEALGLYTIPQPVTTQRHEVNNTSNVKNPYGGKGFMYNGLMNPSIVKPLIPYQVIYNIIHYYREMAIAKNQGKILVLPKGLLIDDDEISQEEAVYYTKADGKLYVDETVDGFNAAQQAIRQVDLSDSNYIQALSQILLELKEEAWEVVGMNRQRYGDTYASDGKGTNEQAIYRAAMGTAPITEVFNQARNKDYMALIDTAKVAFLDDDGGLKPLGSYLNDDGRLEYLSIYPKQFMESEIGLYVASFSRDKDKIEQYKQTAFAAAQNGAFELGLEAIEFENPHKLKQVLKKWRQAEDAKEQQAQQAQQQAAKEAQDRDDQRFQVEQETIRYVADVKAQATIEAAAVRVEVTALQNEQKDAEINAKQHIEEAKTQSKERSDKYKADKQHLTAMKTRNSNK